MPEPATCLEQMWNSGAELGDVVCRRRTHSAIEAWPTSAVPADGLGRRSVAIPLITAGIYGSRYTTLSRRLFENIAVAYTRVEDFRLLGFEQGVYDAVLEQLATRAPSESRAGCLLYRQRASAICRSCCLEFRLSQTRGVGRHRRAVILAFHVSLADRVAQVKCSDLPVTLGSRTWGPHAGRNEG